MTIDVEEWFTGVADAPGEIDRFQSRLDIGLSRLLDLLEQTATRATFFFLGYIAERRPDLIAAVAGRGHEVGCHGLYHRPLWETTPADFRAETARARTALLAAGAPRVDGFRAPLFSLCRETYWAQSILEDLGFRYGSSVFPIRNPRYGFPGAPTLPFLATTTRRFAEFPISTLRAAGMRIPFSGGFYLRALPGRCLIGGFARLAAKGLPGVCYVHPWELDPEQPRLPVSRLTHARHSVGVSTTSRKLAALLSAFTFAPMGDVLDRVAARPLSPLGQWAERRGC